MVLKKNGYPTGMVLRSDQHLTSLSQGAHQNYWSILCMPQTPMKNDNCCKIDWPKNWFRRNCHNSENIRWYENVFAKFIVSQSHHSNILLYLLNHKLDWQRVVGNEIDKYNQEFFIYLNYFSCFSLPRYQSSHQQYRNRRQRAR